MLTLLASAAGCAGHADGDTQVDPQALVKPRSTCRKAHRTAPARSSEAADPDSEEASDWRGSRATADITPRPSYGSWVRVSAGRMFEALVGKLAIEERALVDLKRTPEGAAGSPRLIPRRQQGGTPLPVPSLPASR
jgi:hypothetical protein